MKAQYIERKCLYLSTSSSSSNETDITQNICVFIWFHTAFCTKYQKKNREKKKVSTKRNGAKLSKCVTAKENYNNFWTMVNQKQSTSASTFYYTIIFFVLQFLWFFLYFFFVRTKKNLHKHILVVWLYKMHMVAMALTVCLYCSICVYSVGVLCSIFFGIQWLNWT